MKMKMFESINKLKAQNKQLLELHEDDGRLIQALGESLRGYRDRLEKAEREILLYKDRLEALKNCTDCKCKNFSLPGKKNKKKGS